MTDIVPLLRPRASEIDGGRGELIEAPCDDLTIGTEADWDREKAQR